MKGFEMQESTSGSVDNWGIQQCKDYLSNYPKGLKAEQVRAKLRKLQPPQKEVNQLSNTITTQNVAGTTTSKAMSSPSSYKPRTTSEDGLTTFLKVIATVVCVGVMILGIVLIFQAHPAFIAILPFFYFPIKWMSKIWE